MPAVARKNGTDTVACTDGAQGSVCQRDGHGNPIDWHWDTPTTQATDKGSDNVFVNNIGIVRQNDTMKVHDDGTPCVPSAVTHAPALSTYSGNVYANNLLVGRLGDKYDSDGHMDHTISSGSPNVFANS